MTPLRRAVLCTSITVALGAGWLCGCSTPSTTPAAVASSAVPAAPGPSAETVKAHVDTATTLAGTDLRALMPLCQPASATRASHDEVDKALGALIARPAPAPGQAFDNLYFVGAHWVSAWALKTSEGIILIDALNNAHEAQTLIDAGLRKVGLDPKDIRYVLVTHAHGDHYGGLDWLLKRYRPKVVMSEIDWRMTETKLEFESGHWGPPPKRDVSVNDGDVLTLGDTRVTMHVTPGHTMGTISPVFDVRTGGRTHRVMLWGGTAFNFGRDIARLNSYIRATEQMSGLAAVERIDVMLSNHAGYDGTLGHLEALRTRPAAHDNPFVLGTAKVRRALSVMRECALAQRDRFSM